MIKNSEHKPFLAGDATRLFFLWMLYLTHGFSFGFLDTAMMIILKKYFTYTEVGIVSWWSTPYLIKFLFTPIIESTYVRSIGKRRSWILPSSIIFGILNIVMSCYFDLLVQGKYVYTILVCFISIFMCSAIQDIAVDGWAITMLKQQNHGNATFSKLMGEETGLFVWNTCFFILNDIDFWNAYIYLTPRTEALITEQSFFFCWGVFILLLSWFILFFIKEENDRTIVQNDLNSMNDVMENISWFLTIKRTRDFLLFLASLKIISKFSGLVSRMYLVQELHYNQTKYSFINIQTN